MRFWKNRSQTTVVAVAIAALVVATAGLVSVVVGAHVRGLMQEEIGRSATNVATQVADRATRMISARVGIMRMLARNVDVESPHDPAAPQRLIDGFNDALPYTHWTGLLNPDGIVTLSSDPRLIGIDLSDAPAFQNGLNGVSVGSVDDASRLQHLLPEAVASASDQDHIDLALPRIDKDGRVQGVLMTHIDLAWLRTVQAANASHEGGQATFLIAASGAPVLSSDGNSAFEPSAALADAMTRKASGWLADAHRGDDILTAFSYAEGDARQGSPGWTAVVQQPLHIAFAPVEEMQRDIVLAGLFLAALFSGIGWYIADRITVPLRLMAQAADEVGRGMASDMPELRGSREVAVLSRSLSRMCRSLSEHRAELTEMEGMAYQDRLTALPNRRYFERYLEQNVPILREQGGSLTFLFIDLDGFKPINDRLGHNAGDEVLRQTATRLAGELREGDTMLRLGGDEFVAILRSRSEVPQTRSIVLAQRLIDAVNKPIVLGDEAPEAVRVGCSIGIASWPRHGEEVATVLECADESLYAAKDAGRNMAVLYGGARPQLRRSA